MDAIKVRRREIDRYYRRLLAPIESAGLIRLPVVPAECETHYRSFYMLLEDERTRDGLMEFLRSHNVAAVFHFVPLHLSPMGRRFGYRAGDLPLTEELAGRILRLPSFGTITTAQQDRVAELVSDYLCGRGGGAEVSYSFPTSVAAYQGAET
jgi:dTDP-4-amino-4,6-dideoxygalactose transaminase